MCGGGECGSELCLFQRGGVHICMCVFGGMGNSNTVCSLSMCGLVCAVCLCDVRVSGMYKNKKMYFMIPACVCSMFVSVLV